MSFELFPAIDIRDGRCVRLMHGDYERETVYGDDPVAQAALFAEAGAVWIHVVDLDAARTGEPVNRDIVAAIAGSVDVAIQTGGGVRTARAAEALFEAGVERVVIGTAAVERPELAAELVAAGGRVAVGLDGRRGRVATHGWKTDTDLSVIDVARRFEDIGVDAVVVTDVGVDGTLAGPDVAGLASLMAATSLEIVASGGVGELGHVETLAAMGAGGRGLAGVIVGRAIYEGTVDLIEALELCSRGARS